MFIGENSILMKHIARKFLFVFSLVALFTGCANDMSILQALQTSGSNRAEIETVLHHYQRNKSDSLKYRAAQYLIRYMPYHSSFAGSYARYCNMASSTSISEFF